MTLKEAIAVANQFNDTIFTNTQEMVNAVDVLISYAESGKPGPITGEWLYNQWEALFHLYPNQITASEIADKLAERINKRREENDAK